MEGNIGEIRGFGGNFAPRAWAFCQGQLLSISQNTALFSILGTTYGGDGRTTFALPDLRGRVPISAGTGPGLSTRKLGSRSGQEIVTLNVLQLPSHFHAAASTVAGGAGSITGTASASVNINNTDGPDQAGNGKYLGFSDGGGLYSGTTDGSTLDPGSVTVDTSGLGVNMTGMAVGTTVHPTGGSQPHNNMQPYLTINWIICMQGVFPSRS
jgi:microcystin-dependent protein